MKLSQYVLSSPIGEIAAESAWRRRIAVVSAALFRVLLNTSVTAQMPGGTV
jgi:hypothetical protein